MSQSYFNLFKIAEDHSVFVFGDQFKTSLVQQLAAECVKSGNYAFIISVKPESYPIEGKVLVTDDFSMLTDLIENDGPKVIYLARRISNDLLQPFEPKEINQLAKQLQDPFKLFISVEHENIDILPKFKFIKSSKLICSLNFNLLKESLPELNKLKDLKRKSSSEQVSERVYQLISSMCPKFIDMETKSEKICYIGQIKGMFDENVMLPVARNLKTTLNCRMLIGDINTYNIKEV